MSCLHRSDISRVRETLGDRRAAAGVPRADAAAVRAEEVVSLVVEPAVAGNNAVGIPLLLVRCARGTPVARAPELDGGRLVALLVGLIRGGVGDGATKVGRIILCYLEKKR